MKTKFFFLIVLLSGLSYAQLSNDVPESGPASIGTTSPEPGHQLTVEGDSKFRNAIYVDSDLSVDGQSIMNGIVRMPGISSYAGALENFEIIVTDASGNVTKLTKKDVLNGLSSLPIGLDGCTPAATESPQWYSAPNKLFTICEDIKVGVGTMNPDFLLHVKGVAYAMQMKLGNRTATSDALMSGFSTSHSQALLELGTKRSGEDQEVLFKITNDGVVFAKELRIRKPIDFPDYVFEESYNLLSLDKLREFVKKERHLPNIPSAEEVKKEGIEVGELQFKMIEKIEELTLYILQLEEQNTRLEERLTLVEKSLNH